MTAAIAVARRVSRGGANSTPTAPPSAAQERWPRAAATTSPAAHGGVELVADPDGDEAERVGEEHDGQAGRDGEHEHDLEAGPRAAAAEGGGRHVGLRVGLAREDGADGPGGEPAGHERRDAERRARVVVAVGVDADHEEQRGRERRQRGAGPGGGEREVAQPGAHRRTSSTCQPASRSARRRSSLAVAARVRSNARPSGCVARTVTALALPRRRPRRFAGSPTAAPRAVGGAVAQAQHVGQRDPARRGARVVGEQDRGACVEALGDLRRQPRAAVVVEAGERLVEQQQRAPGLERLEQRDALEHAAAEGRRGAVEDRGVEAARAGGGRPSRSPSAPAGRASRAATRRSAGRGRDGPSRARTRTPRDGAASPRAAPPARRARAGGSSCRCRSRRRRGSPGRGRPSARRRTARCAARAGS